MKADYVIQKVTAQTNLSWARLLKYASFFFQSLVWLNIISPETNCTLNIAGRILSVSSFHSCQRIQSQSLKCPHSYK